MSECKQRFLEFYQRLASIARASRLACVHRATVYRWMEDADFAGAVRNAKEATLQQKLAKALATDAERKRLRAQERARIRWEKQVQAARLREIDRELRAGNPRVVEAVANAILTAIKASNQRVETRG